MPSVRTSAASPVGRRGGEEGEDRPDADGEEKHPILAHSPVPAGAAAVKRKTPGTMLPEKHQLSREREGKKR
jgi:hypothetical protein